MSRRVALIVGGLSTALASAAALLMSRRTATTTRDAVRGAAPPMSPGGANAIKVHLTGYWPFQEGLSAAERRMEGAPVDRRSRPLHTVEDFLAGKSDHVSLSGDPDIFPYGQKIMIPWGDQTLVGRVTDTGGHFHGLGKVFRVWHAEPLDVCVASSKTVIPKKTVDVVVIVGDHLDKSSKLLALDKAGKPQAASVGGLELLGAEVPKSTGNGVKKVLSTDPRWRADAEVYAARHGDQGAWEQSELGVWVWRGIDGSFSSAPPSLLRAMYPGMAALFDFCDRDA